MDRTEERAVDEEWERRRLEIVRSTGLVHLTADTTAEIKAREENKEFDRLTSFACRVIHVPVATIKLIDKDFDWYQSITCLKEGFTIPQTLPRSHHCSRCIEEDAPLVIVAGGGTLKFPYAFYASTPIIVDEVKVGTVSILDVVPHPVFSIKEQSILRDIGNLASNAVAQRRIAFLKVKEQRTSLLAGMTHNLRTPLNTMMLAMDVMSAQVTALESSKQERILPDLANIKIKLKVISSIVESSLMMGKIFVQNSDAEGRQQTSFVLDQVISQIQALLFVSKECVRVQWDIDTSIKEGTMVTSHQDVFMFTILSTVSHFFTAWEKVLIRISMSKRWLPFGTFSQVGAFRKNISQKMEALNVDIGLMGPLFEETAEHRDRYRKILSPASQMLSEIGGYSLEAPPEANFDKKFRFTLPCSTCSNEAQIPSNASVTSAQNGTDPIPIPSPRRDTKLSNGTSASSKSVSVLVVDDSAPIQKVMSKWLHMQGCTVEVASNGKIAFEKLREGSFELMFLDFLMPVMGGVELMKLIFESKTKLESVFIVGMSATATPDELNECFEHGMHFFCKKVIDKVTAVKSSPNFH